MAKENFGEPSRVPEFGTEFPLPSGHIPIHAAFLPRTVLFRNVGSYSYSVLISSSSSSSDTLLRRSDSPISPCRKLCRSSSYFFGNQIQARKRHININFFVLLVLGRPRDCPLDFSLFYTVETRFHRVNRVCPWDNRGDEGRHRKFM